MPTFTCGTGCGVFGRDEGGSEFTFTQQHVDMLISKWSDVVRAVGHNVNAKLTPDTVMVIELCISVSTFSLVDLSLPTDDF